MENPYAAYYLNQAGYGIAGFSGVRYQRGKGLFSKLWSGGMLPLLRFLGQNALTAGYEIAKDAAHGADMASSLRKHLVNAGADVAEQGIKRARQYGQSGQGRKKRAKKTKRKTYKKAKYTKLNI